MTDYSLWEVILNGDSHISTRVINGVVQLVTPTTAEQRLARKNELKAQGRNLGANGTTSIGFDMSMVECYNCHRRGHFSSYVMVLEAMIGAFRQKKNKPTMPSWHLPPQVLPVLIMRDNALVELRKKFEKVEQERDDLKLKSDKFRTSSKNLSQLLASQTSDKTRLGYDNPGFNSSVFDCDEMFSSESDVSIPTSPVYDRYKSKEGYHVIPPPYTGTFMPPKDDLVFHDAPTVNEILPTAFNVAPKDDFKGKPMPTQKASSFVQTTEHVKTPRPSVKLVEHPISAETLRNDISMSQSYRNSRNRNACFVCKSLTHLIKDCNYYEKKMVQKPVKNHAMRVNHQHYARMTHPNPQMHVVPIAVLTRSRLVPLNAARPINTVILETKVNHQRPVLHGGVNGNWVRKPKCPIIDHVSRHISASMTIKQFDYTDALGRSNGCSRHMTGNMSYLSEFKEINVGYVAFGGNPKGGKITGDLTCLFAMATLDESNLWHRRLGYINFQTMNKLVKGCGPSWMFDIDTLTKSMNYQPVLASNQPNPSAGIQEHFDADKAGEGNVQQYVLFPLWCFGSKDCQNTDDDTTFEVKEPESEVYVSPSSSAKTKKHDDAV
nr:ribonuclease H-like domain-containing protein [Tanacetum cinerariifolium]